MFWKIVEKTSDVEKILQHQGKTTLAIKEDTASIVVDDSDENCIATTQKEKRRKVSRKKVKKGRAKSKDIAQGLEEHAHVDYNHTQQRKCDVPEIPKKTKILKGANKSLNRSEETIAHDKRKRRKKYRQHGSFN